MQFNTNGPLELEPAPSHTVDEQNRGMPIGELLVERGLLTDEQVAHILDVQRRGGRPFGDLAERLYGIDALAIEDAWIQQYKLIAGECDLKQIEADEQCLRLINRRQAWQFGIVPMNRDSGHLNVATDADNLVRGLNFSTRHFAEPVSMLLAERGQLRDFLMRHYPVPDHISKYADSLRK
ncbi:MAG: hypothetical protein AAGD32_04260 [Planctomycetota bacterium]